MESTFNLDSAQCRQILGKQTNTTNKLNNQETTKTSSLCPPQQMADDEGRNTRQQQQQRQYFILQRILHIFFFLAIHFLHLCETHPTTSSHPTPHTPHHTRSQCPFPHHHTMQTSSSFLRSTAMHLIVLARILVGSTISGLRNHEFRTTSHHQM
jgi:hypothetical protein